RGWRNYYTQADKGIANRFLSKIDWYIRRRLLIFWRKKHHRRRPSQGIFELLQREGLNSVTTWKRKSTYCPR
ncbi:group II intron maturase-specific domain-containing protein, partial [Paenibacillus aceti]